MNQEWDLNPGHLTCVDGIRTRVTLFTDMVLSDTSSDLGSLRKVLNDNTTDVLDVCWRKLNKKTTTD